MYHFIIRFIFKLFIKKDNINKIKKYDTNKFNTRINIILILRDKTKKYHDIMVARDIIGSSVLCRCRKSIFTGMTVNSYSSFLHGEGHNLDHVQKFSHCSVSIIL